MAEIRELKSGATLRNRIHRTPHEVSRECLCVASGAKLNQACSPRLMQETAWCLTNANS